MDELPYGKALTVTAKPNPGVLALGWGRRPDDLGTESGRDGQAAESWKPYLSISNRNV